MRRKKGQRKGKEHFSYLTNKKEVVIYTKKEVFYGEKRVHSIIIRGDSVP